MRTWDGANFARTVADVQAEAVRTGVPVVDARRGQPLELLFAGAGDLGGRRSSAAATIEPLEGPIVAKPVARLPATASKLRYFLDGSQRTLMASRIGCVPIIAAISAAAILARDAEGRCAVHPGSLRLEHAWIIPRALGHPDVDRFLAAVERRGMRVVDPLIRLPREEDVAALTSDYGRLVELAYVAARDERERLEGSLVAAWANGGLRPADDGWLVVDGRLHVEADRAIGLVKQFSDADFSGSDAVMLLGLPAGFRTTAFNPGDRRRGGDRPEARTVWYLRLHDADGLEARHALVKIEADLLQRTTAEIDRISGWVLNERVPRATGDERWATLLYPIHLLERTLKRRIDADCRGWPSA